MERDGERKERRGKGGGGQLVTLSKGKKRKEKERRWWGKKQAKNVNKKNTTNMKLAVMIVLIGMRQRLFIALLLYKHSFRFQVWGWSVNKFDLTLWN